MTLNDFRRIFHLPQAIDNNHERFVAALKFSKMVPFFFNTLDFTLELRSPSNFKTTGLVQPWQTLGKIFARFLTTRVTGHDQLPLQIMQIARDKYHNLDRRLRCNDVVFGVDFPMTQSHPIESTQGTHRTISASRSPNPETNEGESSALRNYVKPRSDKESPEVEITAKVQPVNIDEDEEKLAKDDYELEIREKGSMYRNAIQQERENLRSEISSQINDAIANHIPLQHHSSGQVTLKVKQGPATSGFPTEKVSQELVDEMSHIVDEAKLRKVVDEMLRQRCTSGDDFHTTIDRCKLLKMILSIVIWERVHDFQLGVESYQQKVNLTALTITFPGIEKYKMFSIISELVYDIIYKNNKKEKRVVRHQEVHKFCDATLKRVLEGLKSYNNDVKPGYVTPSLSKEDVEYLQLFKEEIEERLKHHD
ncbi:hypothetical protein Tco_1410888 [Tanacetum coccineum]